MSVITSEVSGGTRKGPHGRREVYVSGTGWVPAEQAPPDALKPKASPTSGAPVRLKPHGPTQRQSEIWAAVEAHGGQTAAARALGITQGGVSSAVRGYAKAMERAGTPVSPPPSERFEVKGHQPQQHPPDYWRANGGSNQQVTQEPEASLNGGTPDLNVEPAPGEPAATLAGMGALPARPLKPELPYPPEIPELPEIELVDEGDIQRAHCVGYASGYAVATLRILAAWPDGVPVSDAVRDMATDAADGLLA